MIFFSSNVDKPEQQLLKYCILVQACFFHSLCKSSFATHVLSQYTSLVSPRTVTMCDYNSKKYSWRAHCVYWLVTCVNFAS